MIELEEMLGLSPGFSSLSLRITLTQGDLRSWLRPRIAESLRQTRSRVTSEDNDNAAERMTFYRYQACANMTRIFYGILAATIAVKAYQAQATGSFHDLSDPDDLLEGLMSNAVHATVKR